MHDGKVKCCGSTLFLKKTFHVGYLLRVQLSGDLTEADQLLGLIRQYIPDAFFETQRANEIFYRLALSEERTVAGDNLNLMIAQLLDAFEDLEIKKQYQIETFGLTNTSLEDVFIKIGTLDAPQEKAITVETVEDHPLHNLQRLSGFALYLQQLWAIQCKKLKLSYKNLSLLWQSIYFVMPIVLLAIGLTPAFELIIKQFNDGQFNLTTFNLNQLKNNEVWAVKNEGAGSVENNLFRQTNLDWLNKEYGLKASEVEEKTAEEVVKKRTSEYGSKKFNDVFGFATERLDEYDYRLTINPFKRPYSVMGTLEMFYRLIARQKNEDFDVNANFHYFQPKGPGTLSYKNSLGNVFRIAFIKVMTAVACSFAIALMFSFPFIAFVELPHEERNSGVSFN